MFRKAHILIDLKLSQNQHAWVILQKRADFCPVIFLKNTVKLQLCELMGTEIRIIGQPMIDLQFDT